MKPFAGLYAITPEGLTGESLIRQVRLAIDGGVTVLQYRKKNLPQKQALEEAAQLAALCQQLQVTFIINDDHRLAKAVKADGVHLGKDDQSMKAARNLLGDTAIIGISCYADLDRAIEAQAQGASYVAFGRFFPSRSKPNATPAPLDLLEQAKANLHIPIIAIGGIQPEQAALLFTKGADMIAVIDGIFGQPDARQAAQQYLIHC
jgi:thiamine-phosphate pyrophosphorylase